MVVGVAIRMVAGGLVVKSEQVRAEVAVELTPHRMYVIGAVLGVVVLEEEMGCLDAVVVSLTRLEATGPCEVHAATLNDWSSLTDLLGDLYPVFGDELADQIQKHLLDETLKKRLS